MTTYNQFLEKKQIKSFSSGLDVPESEINKMLFPFQKILVKWALKKGKAAIFADTGLGKTPMQLEWADQIHKRTDKNILVIAPLCVSQQTTREGKKFNIDIHYCRHHEDTKPGINITNYEMLDNFDLSLFGGVVLDESSILKYQQGKTRTKIIKACQGVPFRLSCTATPSPNDFMELGSQAEFLGVMSAVEMLAMYFVHDGGETSKWRLKGHGKYKFWEWMAQWAVVIKKPSDIGYLDTGYDLPPLNMIEHKVECKAVDGFMFPEIAQGLLDRNRARKESVNDRVQMCAELINASDEPWLVWCHLNDESIKLASLINDSQDIKGSDSIEKKEAVTEKFIDGKLKVLISKPSISGFGLNLQHVHNMAFVGLSDSWEQFYQAIRRCYRFGQKEIVNVHVIAAETEGAVLANIKRKEKQAKEMSESMVKQMGKIMYSEIFETTKQEAVYMKDMVKTDKWEMHLGDCVELSETLKDESIDYTVFSPPFASLYTYSNSDRDMGNSADDEQFYKHFEYLVENLFRITKPGRLVSFHCMNLPTSKQNHGFIGLRDFRGELIKMFTDKGFIYHSEVCIWKDPVIAMQRTKALGLLWKQIKKDSSMSRMGLPDYVVTMRKPGQNLDFIDHSPEDYPVKKWQNVASPIWTDINPSNTLNKNPARENDDERHICPLQLDVIERCLELWSKRGDLVFSPFGGIGSEGYQALKMDRRFLGVELKKSYFDVAIQNLKDAKINQTSIFDEE
jgi:DNA modification methylase